MAGAASNPDPYALFDSSTNHFETGGWKSVAGRSARSPTINPAKRTLVFLSSGQSLLTNVCPTLYVPTNASVIDNLDLYGGGLYDCAGPLLGCTAAPFLSALGPGNVMLNVADLLVTNNKFDRVILGTVGVGSTPMRYWDTGRHANRIKVAMARLAQIGITPGMTGVTFAAIMADGHQDLADGTSQSAWTNSCNTWIANTIAAGMNGRIFVCSESASGQTSNAIRSAQAAVRDGVTVFDGGDIDSSSIGTSDGVHPSDAGRATMATIIYNAMHASGAPY